jgi:hypothetical protein
MSSSDTFTATLALRPKKMAPPPLLTLPNELLAEICSYLCWHCKYKHVPFKAPSGDGFTADNEQMSMRSDLWSVALTCRRLRAVGEPFLYHFLEVTQDQTEDIGLFLRAIDNRPELRGSVREFMLGCFILFREYDWLPSVVADRLNIVYSRPHEGLAIWQRDRAVHGEAQGVYISALLELAPRLKSLYVTLSGREWLQLPPESGVSIPPLVSLQNLAIDIKLKDAHPFDRAEPILLLAPNLQRLQLDERTDRAYGPNSVTAKMELAALPRLQNLTDLRLIDTRLTATCFATLLRAVGPGLSKVIIRRHSPSDPDVSWDGGDIIQFDDVIRGLQPWRDTLKELSFIVFHLSTIAMARDRHVVNLLCEFRTLEVLRAAAGCFNFDGVGGPQHNALASALPASLREFRLFAKEPYGPLIVPLRVLLDDIRAGKFPRLRRLETDARAFRFGPEGAGIAEDLGASFRLAGVDFTLHPPQKLGDTSYMYF